MTLDQPIEIQRKTQVQQADGSLATTFTVLTTAFASVKKQRGGESSQSDQTEAVASYIFTIHARTDLLEDDVIVWRSRLYNIRFIDDMGHGQVYMQIEAERGVAV